MLHKSYQCDLLVFVFWFCVCVLCKFMEINKIFLLLNLSFTSINIFTATSFLRALPGFALTRALFFARARAWSFLYAGVRPRA